MNERNLIEPIEEHDALVRDRTKFNLLMDAIFNSATLSYDKQSLVFNYMEILPIVKALDYETYDNVLRALKAENDRAISPMD